MPSTKGLTPAKPGQCINPNGRPKGASLKTQVQNVFIEMMSDPIKKNGKTQPFLTAYKQEFVKQAMSGGWSAKILAERLFNDNILDQIDASLNRDIRQNIDFQKWRVYNKAHDKQQDVLNSKSKRIAVMAGRRAGKTEALILKTLQTVVEDYKNVLVISLTSETCLKLYWKPLIDGLENLGWDVSSANRLEGTITLGNGSTISLKGNNSVTDREKFRGSQWDVVIIDEAQSQTALPYLINDVIEPTLLDRAGQLLIAGTGPRVAGTYWEVLWNDGKYTKYNWNISHNPFIPDYLNILEWIKKEKGLTNESPLFQREYLGMCVYDVDAQVWRLKDDNYYTDEEFSDWVARQPVSDIKFTAGLDYGYADSDAFVIVCYSDSSPEKFIISEYKASRTGVTELYQAIQSRIDQVKSNPLFSRSVIMRQGPWSETTPDIDKNFYIFCDTNEQKISQEFRTQYNLPTVNAYKYDKDLAIELLQEEIKTGHLKMKKGSAFDDECLKTVWSRDEADNLVRKIDDKEYHPDVADALIYSLRWIWKYAQQPLI